jgi:hypothetical protein
MSAAKRQAEQALRTDDRGHARAAKVTSDPLARQFLGFALITVSLAFSNGRAPCASMAANPNLARRIPRLPRGRKSR